MALANSAVKAQGRLLSCAKLVAARRLDERREGVGTGDEGDPNAGRLEASGVVRPENA
jgi:hypothetical protein